ncbi:MAG: HlyD family efflux transporter periplasmic adaptor subunit, partial [Desulfobacterales bacterium]|nr:HlyD family efflux transporter periplasmic adaptor subunit [Desulfobacterales bacterium]
MVEMEKNDLFCQTILDAIYDHSVGQLSTVDFKLKDGTPRVLSVSTSYLKENTDNEAGNDGVVVVFSDITEATQSRENEKALNLQLREAFIKTEETNKQLESALKKVHWIRVFITFVVILGFSGTGYYLLNQDFFSSTMLTPETKAGPEAAQGMSAVEVMTKPLTSSISLSGFVAPLEEISVLAPFDGKVLEKYFFYDEKVEKGDRLVAMDTTKLMVDFRKAKALYIKAGQNNKQLSEWKKSSEVSSAKRSFTKASNSLDTSKRKLEESQVLLDKGIISKTEFKSAQTEYINQQLDFTASKEALDSVLNKANRENLDIARMELANAKANMEEIKEKLTGATIHAPVSGIVIKPSQNQGKTKESKEIEPGLSISQGDVLMSIGNLDGFSIKAQVDEIDISKIQFNQKVNVSGDAFAALALTGRVRRIASNAVSKGKKGPMFDVEVAIDHLALDQQKKIRLGMSTNLEIVVYENPDALMIPLAAVEVRGNKRWVKVMDDSGAGLKKIEITTGMTTLNAVEVLTGLSQGDQVFFMPWN